MHFNDSYRETLTPRFLRARFYRERRRLFESSSAARAQVSLRKRRLARGERPHDRRLDERITISNVAGGQRPIAWQLPERARAIDRSFHFSFG